MKTLTKKIVSVLFLLSITICLTSCFNFNNFTKFYKKSTLKDLGLDGLSKPNYEFVYNSAGSIYGNISYDEFSNYVVDVYDCLMHSYDYVETFDSNFYCYVSGRRRGYLIKPTNNELSNYLTYEYDKYNEVISVTYNFIYFNENDLIDDYTKNEISLAYYYKDTFISNNEYNFKMMLPIGSIKYDTYFYNLSFSYFKFTFFLNKPFDKYPFLLVDEEIKKYDYIISSSTNILELNENIENINNNYIIKDYQIIGEHELFYGINVTYEYENDEKNVNVISFKKNKYDFDTNSFLTCDNNEIRKILCILLYFDVKDADDMTLSGFDCMLRNDNQIKFVVYKVKDISEEKIYEFYRIDYDINKETKETSITTIETWQWAYE